MAGPGICALDEATPVLPQLKRHELFSLASPAVTPISTSPLLARTPYEDQVEPDFPNTGGSLADLPTPNVPPGDEMVNAGNARSPFSPSGDRGGSPFSEAG